MASLIRNFFHERLRPRVELIQFPLQGGADEAARRVSLLFKGVELILQLDRKLNNNANKLGHDRHSRWDKVLAWHGTSAHAVPC